MMPEAPLPSLPADLVAPPGPEPSSLNGRLLALRCGAQLIEIANLVRKIEAGFISASGTVQSPDLQRFDLVLQQIEGLAQVLSAASAALPDVADDRFDAAAALPRLQILSDALRGLPVKQQPASIDLF